MFASFAPGPGPRGGSDRREFVIRVLIAAGVVATLVLLLLFIAQTLYVLLLVFAGILLAVFLRGLAQLVGPRLRLSTSLALGLVILLLLGVLALFLWLVSPNIVDQFNELTKELPTSAREIRELIQRTRWGDDIMGFFPEPGGLARQVGEILSRARGIFSTTLGALTGLFIVLFVGLYLAFDPGIYVRGGLKLFPRDFRGRMEEVLEALRMTILHWLLGRIFGMTVVGVATWLGLLVLGIPLALSLGVFAGIMTFIPNLGPILSIIPALLLGLPEGWQTVFFIIALYLGIQTVESYVLTPLVQQYAVSLPPVLIITAQLVMGIFAGILGLILATPLAAVSLVLVRKLYIEDILGNGMEPHRK